MFCCRFRVIKSFGISCLDRFEARKRFSSIYLKMFEKFRDRGHKIMAKNQFFFRNCSIYM